MKESSAKSGFKVISITALILKIITILTIIAVLSTIIFAIVKNRKNEKEIEESQVVAEIVYTEDVKEISDLEKLQNFFGLKVYDKEKAENNIFSITVLATMIFVIEFILLVLIFDGIQRIFKNLYKTDDGFATKTNARIIKNIGIIAILRFLIPLTTNIITKLKLAATVKGNIGMFQTICAAIIVLVSFLSYYKIKAKLKAE